MTRNLNGEKHKQESGRRVYLVSASIDDSNMRSALVMFPRFLVLSTSNSYNLLSMLMTSSSFFASLASLARMSLLQARLSLSCASTHARFSKLKSFTKSTKLSEPTAFLFRPVEPGVSSPGVPPVGDPDVVAALPTPLDTRT